MKLTDGRGVRYEYPLDDSGKADYALFDRQGRALAVLEAKRTSVNLGASEAQNQRYADQLGVTFTCLSTTPSPRAETVFSQYDLTHRKAVRDITVTRSAFP